MSPISNYPSLRFAEFTDSWEQQKLGDMVSFSKGAGYSKGDLKADGTPIILYGRLYTKYETVISEVDTFVDAKAGSVYSKGGEVIVPGSGETAEDISIASVVENSGVLLGGDLNVITPPEDIDPAFLAISISNGKPHNDMAKMAQGKSVVHLHNSDLAKIDFPYPCYEEQRKISGFFSNIDNLIALHQRKYEKLQIIRKTMLIKMFPCDEKNIPEIRFAGFTAPWELRKFSNIAQRQSTMCTSDASLPSVEYEDIVSDRGILNKDLYTKTAYKKGIRFTSEDVLYGKLRPYLHNWLNPDFDGVAVGDWWVLRPIQTDKNYLYWLIQTSRYDEAANQSSGTKMPRADWKHVSSVEFMMPSSIEEQSQIASLFNILDNLITLHQRKCEKLQNIKIAMLKNMFVS